MTTSTDTGTKTEPPAEPPAGDDKGGSATLGDVKAMVVEAVNDAIKPFKDLLGGAGSGAPAPSSSGPSSASPVAAGPDIDSMIDRALAKVLGDQDAKRKEDEHAAEHAKLREAATETAPVDRPRRAKWLGNIYDS